FVMSDRYRTCGDKKRPPDPIVCGISPDDCELCHTLTVKLVTPRHPGNGYLRAGEDRYPAIPRGGSAAAVTSVARDKRNGGPESELRSGLCHRAAWEGELLGVLDGSRVRLTAGRRVPRLPGALPFIPRVVVRFHEGVG